MSHELRTPLNAIIGFSTIIRDETMGAVGSAKYKEYASDICSSGEHLLEIINDVLDLVKLEAGRMPVKSAPVDLLEVVGSIVKLTQPSAAAAGLKLVFDADPALRPIESDATKIRQIAFNLLSNAVKFTANGGIVTVKLWQSPAQRMTRLVVIDNGIGMKETDLAVAFAPFGQVDSGLNRKFEGTGLGLTLSRKLAVTLGGKIEIESRPGVGTTVTVTLPGPMASAAALLTATG
jgi:signal transduction histidine kinase